MSKNVSTIYKKETNALKKHIEQAFILFFSLAWMALLENYNERKQTCPRWEELWRNSPTTVVGVIGIHFVDDPKSVKPTHHY
jgi:hypothetical protein